MEEAMKQLDRLDKLDDSIDVAGDQPNPARLMSETGLRSQTSMAGGIAGIYDGETEIRETEIPERFVPKTREQELDEILPLKKP